MRQLIHIGILLLTAQPIWGLNQHPRIWLTPSLISTVTAKMNANDQDWLALKSQADTYKSFAVAPYDRSACSTKQICYTYEGLGWSDAMIKLSLVYRITGDTSYAAQAKALLAAMNAPYKNSGDLSPITLDSGYPTRSALFAMAIGYDWLYDYLDADTKADTVNTINAAYSWYTGPSGPYCKDGADCVYNNYFGGHLLAFGAAADATDGDNSTSSAIYSTVSGLLTKHLAIGLQPPPVTISQYTDGYWYASGGFAGGGVPESYSYGTSHNERIWELIWLWKSSGRADLTANYMPWMKSSVKSLVYALRPNSWQVGDEGDMPGSCTGVLFQDYPLFLAYLLNGTTEGAWSEYLYRNMKTNPCDSTLAPPQSYQAVLWKDSTRTAADYTQALPTNYSNGGDGHLHARSDWSSASLYLMFNGSSANFTGHMNYAAGNIEVQRGSDYLLVDSAQWKGTPGYGGNPSNFATSAQYSSTLYFDDGGAYNYSGGSYNGGQMPWGTTQILAQKTVTGLAYQLSDLGSAYDKRPDSRVPASRTARFYYRSVAYLGGNTIFVWDRFRAKSSAYTKRLQWHLNPTNAPSLNGSIISTSKGSSALFIDTLLPASPSIVTARDIATSDGSTPLTYNMQVSDSVVGTDLNALTVMYATASSGSLPATAAISTDTNWVGAQVQDSTPLVAVFAKTVQDNGNNTYTPLTYTSTSFVSTHTGTGKYLVAGLKTGTYAVLQNGVVVPGYSAVTVGTDGTLLFTATAGSFSITAPSANAPCDLNGDGVVNSTDVQLAINQSLGSAPCTNADLDANGTCNVVDVQRIINASNGLGCKVGP